MMVPIILVLLCVPCVSSVVFDAVKKVAKVLGSDRYLSGPSRLLLV